MHNDKRGLRFQFNADAEVRTETSDGNLRGRVVELSLRGCFLEVTGSFTDHQVIRVKAFHGGEYFEAAADVIYIRPNGIGVLFADMNPHFRAVLQRWILFALERETAEVAAS